MRKIRVQLTARRLQAKVFGGEELLHQEQTKKNRSLSFRTAIDLEKLKRFFKLLLASLPQAIEKAISGDVLLELPLL